MVPWRSKGGGLGGGGLGDGGSGGGGLGDGGSGDGGLGGGGPGGGGDGGGGVFGETEYDGEEGLFGDYELLLVFCILSMDLDLLGNFCFF